MSTLITEAQVEAMTEVAIDGPGYVSFYPSPHDCRRLLEAALSTEPEGAEGWRDMDDAPRDGSKFLAFEKGRYFDCWWEDKGYGEAYWMDEADSEPNPSRWRMLPAAPLPEDTATRQAPESDNG